MAQTDLAIRIATILDASGINKAGKAVDGFDKKLKGLGRTLGLTLSGAAVVAFGKKSVNAFIQAEKANIRLANSVKNLGLSFAQADIQANLDKISRSAGIAGEVLVDAIQPLLQVTGSVVESQKMLQLALDISAGSGVDLLTVTQDLSKAYVGQTRGLSKYNLGLTQAELKTLRFSKAQELLNAQFGGSQAAYLATYAGKLQVLTEALGTAQERIGGAIIDLALAYSQSSDIDQFITKIENFTDKVIKFFDAFTEGIAILKAVLGAKTWRGMFDAAQKAQVDEFNRRMRRDYMKAWDGVDIPQTAAQKAAAKAAEAAAKKRAEQIRKEQEKQTRELKKQAALKKAGTVFDREQVERIAALKGQLSDQDRKRVEAQLAILNENDVLAQKLTREILMAQDATGGLYRFFLTIGDAKIKNPFAFLDDWIIQFQNKMNNLRFPTVPSMAAVAPTSGIVPNFIPPDLGVIASNKPVQGPVIPPTNLGTIPTGNFTYGQGNPLNTNVYVTVQGSVTTERDLINSISKGLQDQSLSSGNSSNIVRRSSAFGL
jgi:hypothetical protein